MIAPFLHRVSRYHRASRARSTLAAGGAAVEDAEEGRAVRQEHGACPWDGGGRAGVQMIRFGERRATARIRACAFGVRLRMWLIIIRRWEWGVRGL